MNRSLADPTRIRIYDALSDGPSTVAQLAERLGVPADRLYYHLDLLEQAGVVRLRSVRPKRVYELASLLEDDPVPLTAVDKAELAGAVLEAARLETETVLRRRGGPQQVVLTYATAQLSGRDLVQLRARIGELVAELSERPRTRATRRTRVVFAAYVLDE